MEKIYSNKNEFGKLRIAVNFTRIISVISVLIWLIAAIAGTLVLASYLVYYQINHNFGNAYPQAPYLPFVFAPLSVIMLYLCVKLFFRAGRMLGALDIGDFDEFGKLLSLTWIVISIPATWVVGCVTLVAA